MRIKHRLPPFLLSFFFLSFSVSYLLFIKKIIKHYLKKEKDNLFSLYIYMYIFCYLQSRYIILMSCDHFQCKRIFFCWLKMQKDWPLKFEALGYANLLRYHIPTLWKENMAKLIVENYEVVSSWNEGIAYDMKELIIFSLIGSLLLCYFEGNFIIEFLVTVI